jgi:hypothetical protein
MKFESKMCQWCWQSVPFDPSRIVSDRFGTVVLRGQDGRTHSFRSKLKEDENNEQEDQQIGAEEREGGQEIVQETSESETEREREEFLRFSQFVLGD